MKKKLFYVFFLIFFLGMILLIMPKNDALGANEPYNSDDLVNFNISIENKKYVADTKSFEELSNNSITVGDYLYTFIYVENLSSEKKILSSISLELKYDETFLAYSMVSFEEKFYKWRDLTPAPNKQDPNTVSVNGYNYSQSNADKTKTFVESGEKALVAIVKFEVLTKIGSSDISISSNSDTIISDFYAKCYKTNITTPTLTVKNDYLIERDGFFSVYTTSRYDYDITNEIVDVTIAFTNSTDHEITFDSFKTNFRIKNPEGDSSGVLDYFYMQSGSALVNENATFSHTINSSIDNVVLSLNNVSITLASMESKDLFKISLRMNDVSGQASRILEVSSSEYKEDSLGYGAIEGNIRHRQENPFSCEFKYYNLLPSNDCSLKELRYKNETSSDVNIGLVDQNNERINNFTLPKLMGVYRDFRLYLSTVDSKSSVEVRLGTDLLIEKNADGYYHFSLEYGENNINIEVTAEDGTIEAYIINVVVMHDTIGDYSLLFDDKAMNLTPQDLEGTQFLTSFSTKTNTMKVSMDSAWGEVFEIYDYNENLLDKDNVDISLGSNQNSKVFIFKIYSEDLTTMKQILVNVNIKSSDSSLVKLEYINDALETTQIFNDELNKNMVSINNGQKGLLFSFNINANTNGNLNFLKALLYDESNKLIEVDTNTADIIYDNGSIGVNASYDASTSNGLDAVIFESGGSGLINVYFINNSSKTKYIYKTLITVTSSSGITMNNISSTTMTKYKNSSGYLVGSNRIDYNKIVDESGYKRSNGTTNFSEYICSSPSVSVYPYVNNPLAKISSVTVNNNLVNLANGCYSFNVLEGSNKVVIRVVAQDESYATEYKFDLVKFYSEATLDKIFVNEEEVIQSDKEVSGYDGYYKCEVSNDTTNLSIRGTTLYNSSFSINGNLVISEGISELECKKYEIIIRSQNGVNSKRYLLEVTRVGNDDSSLKNIILTNGGKNIDFGFNSNTFIYNISVDYEISNLDFNIESSKPLSTIVLNEDSANGNLNVAGVTLLTHYSDNLNYKLFNIVVTSSSLNSVSEYKLYIHRREDVLLKVATYNGVNITITKDVDYTIDLNNNVAHVVPVFSGTSDVVVTAVGMNGDDLNAGFDVLVGVSYIVRVNVASKYESDIFSKTEKNYVFRFNRKGSSIATLSYFSYDDQSNILEDGVLNYTKDYDIGTTSAMFYYSVTDISSKIYLVKGNSSNLIASSGSMSVSSLVSGNNNYILRVVAEDGKTTFDYNINFYVKGNVNMDIALMISSDYRYVASLQSNGSYRFNVDSMDSSINITAILYNPLASVDEVSVNLVDDITYTKLRVNAGNLYKDYDVMIYKVSNYYESNVRSAKFRDNLGNEYNANISLSHHDSLVRYAIWTVVPYGLSSINISGECDSGYSLTNLNMSFDSSSVALMTKKTDYNYVVSGGANRKYSIIVLRGAPSEDTSISNIMLNNKYSPVFNEITGEYDLEVPFDVENIKMTSYNLALGASVVDENYTDGLSLTLANNTYRYAFKVVAMASNSKQYVINIKRAASNDTSLATLRVSEYFINGKWVSNSDNTVPLGYSEGVYTYNTSVVYQITKVKIVAFLATTATSSIDKGEEILELTSEGITSTSFMVTAQDGVTKKSYTINVNRLPRKSVKKLEGIEFFEYIDGNYVSIMNQTFTDEVNINDLYVSYLVSSVYVKCSFIGELYNVVDCENLDGYYRVDLEMPTTNQATINSRDVVVYAEDESSVTYQFSVHRRPNNDPGIKGFVIPNNIVSFTDSNGNNIVLNNEYYEIDPTISEYSIVLPNEASNVAISALTVDSYASVSMSVASGVLSTTKPLIYKFVSLAMDGVSRREYSISVIKEKSSLTTIGDDIYINSDSSGRILVSKDSTGEWNYTFDYNINKVVKVELTNVISSRSKLELRVGDTTIASNGLVFNGEFMLTAPTSSESTKTVFYIDVYAENETLTTYILNIYRKASSDTTVSGFMLSDGYSVDGFNVARYNYYLTLDDWNRELEFSASLLLPVDSLASVSEGLSKKLKMGENTEFRFRVTAQNGVDYKEYTLNVTIGASNDSHLDKITVIYGDLSSEVVLNVNSVHDFEIPRFCEGVTFSVSSGDYSEYVSSITYSNESTSKISLDTLLNVSEPIRDTLGNGVRVYTYANIEVVSENTVDKSVYRFRFYRSLDTNCYIDDISIVETTDYANGIYYNTFINEAGDSKVSFNKETTSYKVFIYTSQTNITLKASSTSTAIIRENNKKSYTNDYVISEDSKEITIRGLSESGDILVYTINIVKRANTLAELLSITSNIDNSVYTPDTNNNISLSVDYSVANIGFTYSVSSGASISCSNNLGNVDITNIELNLPDFDSSSVTNFSIVVSSEDLNTSTTYNVSITRMQDDSKLINSVSFNPSHLGLNEVFSSNLYKENHTYEYTITVINTINTVGITLNHDSNVRVSTISNGYDNKNSIEKSFNPGDVSRYEFYVYSMSGSVDTYVFTLTCLKDAPVTLEGFELSSGSLNEEFNKERQNYTVDVLNDVSQLSIKALTQKGLTIKVYTPSNNSSGLTLLNNNTITKSLSSSSVNVFTFIVIYDMTGENYSLTYNVMVTRAKSSVASLDGATITTNLGEVREISFDGANVAYANFVYNTTHVDIALKYKSQNSSSNIDENGYDLILPVDEFNSVKEISVVVTSEDLAYTNTYTIRVIVEPDTFMGIDSIDVEYYYLNGDLAGSKNYIMNSNILNIDKVSNEYHKAKVNINMPSNTTASVNVSYVEHELVAGIGVEYKFIVTAMSKASRTYTIFIKKNKNEDNSISDFKFSYNLETLVEVMGVYTPNVGYLLEVPYEVSSVVVSAKYNVAATSNTTDGSIVVNMPNPGVYSGEYIVISESEDKAIYKYQITRLKDDRVDINGIKVFDEYATLVDGVYKYDVSYLVDKVNVSIDFGDNLTATSNSVYEDYAINTGENELSFEVLSQNGTAKTYKLIITRALNDEASFSRLFFVSDKYEFELFYDPNTLTWSNSSDVAYFITSGSITWVKGSENYLSENAYVEGANDSIFITLNEVIDSSGSKTSTDLSIYAQNGDSITYSVVISRASDDSMYLDNIIFDSSSKYSFSPMFSKNILEYNVEVKYSATPVSYSISGIINSDRTQKLESVDMEEITGVISSGEKNEHSIVVVAQNAVDKNTYKINVSMEKDDARNLNSLTFNDGVNEYDFVKGSDSIFKLEVPYSVSGGSIDFNISPSASIGKVVDSNGNDIDITNITLDSPTNRRDAIKSFTVSVVAQNGVSISDYRCEITRKRDNVKSLKSLSVYGYDIKFDENVLEYELVVSSDVDSVDISYELYNLDTQNVIESSTGSTLVNTRDNVYSYLVTAQNGESNVYRIVVKKLLSDNVSFGNLRYDIGGNEFNLLYNPDIDLYYQTFPYEVSFISLKMDTYDGTVCLIDSSYELITPTSKGSSVTTIKLTAYSQSGNNSKEIIINITRERDTTNGISDLYLSNDAALNKDIKLIESVKSDRYNYNVRIPYSKEFVYVVAKTKSSNSYVVYKDLENESSEAMLVELSYGESRTISVYVYSQSGDELVYNINITKGSPSDKCDLDNITILGSYSKKDYSSLLTHEDGVGFRSDIYEYSLIVDGADDLIVNGSVSLYATVSGFKTYDKFNVDIYIDIIAEDNINKSRYVIHASKRDSNTDLSNLEVLGYDISFDKDVLEYDLIIYQNEASSITINAVGENNLQTISGSGEYSLNVGDNEFIISVTAENGDVKEYIIRVDYVTPNGNAYLSNLIIKGYDISFNKRTYKYEITMNNDDLFIDVAAYPESNVSSVSGDGRLELSWGDNEFEFVVTAQNGNTRSYFLLVHLNDVYNDYLKDLTVVSFEDQIEFDKYVNEYTINVVGDYSTINVIATPMASSSVVSGDGILELDNDINVFFITCKALKNFERTYKLTVNYTPLSKDASLKSLSVDGYEITPEFESDCYLYELDIIEDIDHVIVNAEASSPLSEIINGVGKIMLNEKENIINVIVRAFDGNELTYQIIINLTTSKSNNYLSELSVKGGYIEFDPYVYEYMVLLPQDTLTTEIIAKASSSLSNVSIDGDLNLISGDNEFIISVKSSLDEVREYKVVVVRPMSNQSRLQRLAVDDYDLYFDPYVYEYVINVDESVDRVNIDAETLSTLATLKGIGDVTLNYGENKFSVTTLSEDLKNSNVYNITINRALCSNNYLKDIFFVVNEKDIIIPFDKNVMEYEVTISGNELFLDALVEHETAEYEVIIPQKINSKSDLIIKVTAQNGAERLYVIHITRTDFAWLMYISFGIIAISLISQGVYIGLKRRYFVD